MDLLTNISVTRCKITKLKSILFPPSSCPFFSGP